MFAPFSRIGFCGSRSLPDSAQTLVTAIVTAALRNSTARIAVGCSVGADSLVLASVPSSFASRLSVFAAFGPNARGACPFSDVQRVTVAARSGASVMWWAGGALDLPLRARLANRTSALVRFLAQSSPSALFCFLSSLESAGSLRACRLAARLGVSVFVAAIDLPVDALPAGLPRLGRGSWHPLNALALQIAPERGLLIFQWLPPQKQPELFSNRLT